MADGQFEITFKANPIQHRFIRARPEKDGTQEAHLFNSRLGEGKSTALVWCPLHHTMKNPGSRWAIVRDTFTNLEKTTMEEFFKWFPPGIAGTYHSGKKEWTWGLDGIHGKVLFIGMDDEKAATKVQSLELAGFCIDEVSPVAGTGGVSKAVFQTLMQRLRQPGVQYYVGKLAQNNPDESNWTYPEFVDPGAPKRVVFQTASPENLSNLPADYYADVTQLYAGQEDKIRRFVRGEYGFIQEGKPMTSGWSDAVHLADRLAPLKRVSLHLLWDFGLNPTCLITQITPLGHWNFLDAYVGDGIGVVQLIEDEVKPRLVDRYSGFHWDHTGDPAGAQREQSNSNNTAVKAIKDHLGGTWRPGPVPLDERMLPLNAVMGRMLERGRGVIQVDRVFAKAAWHAFRGGWHRQVHRGGIASPMPLKNIHSHPGDAAGYGAARFFPQGRPKGAKKPVSIQPKIARFFGRPGERVLSKLPKHGDKIETIRTRRL